MRRQDGQERVSLVSVFEALDEAAGARKPLVVAQLGQSLDGRIATVTGHSHYVNGKAALTVLHRLRAGVDAVVVGAGTALADDPRLTVRHCEGADPARVLIDRRRRAGARLKMLQGDGTPRMLFGPPLDLDPPGILYRGTADTTPAAILAALAAEGWSRILVEGGAQTVGRFLEAGALHRLVVLVAPMIIGAGPMGLSLPPIATLDEALRPRTRISVLCDGDVMFDCAV